MQEVAVTSVSEDQVDLAEYDGGKAVEVTMPQPDGRDSSTRSSGSIKLSALKPRLETRGTLKKMLSQADKNKDGKITMDELIDIIEATFHAQKVTRQPSP